MPMTYTYHLNYICIPEGGTPSELDCCIDLPVKLQSGSDIEQLKAALARDFIASNSCDSVHTQHTTAALISIIIRNITLLHTEVTA